MKKAHHVAVVAAAVALTTRLAAQASAPKPSFDVVSIKPSAPLGNGPVRIGGGTQGDRFSMSSATLRMLLQTAYQHGGVTPFGQMQIVGGPGWMDSDRFDVQAKADCSGGPIPRERLQLMVQSLLEDRFRLKAHLETRELPVYDLVIGKDGPKIARSADQTPSAPPIAPPEPCAPGAAAVPPFPGRRGGGPPFGAGVPPPRGSASLRVSTAGMTLRATATRLAIVVGMLQQQLGRPVVDKTGLDGLYDFEMTFSREGLDPSFGRTALGLPPAAGAPAADAASSQATALDTAPSIFTAIQQLGLKLESAKGPVDVLVIDAVEKPTEN